MRKIKYLGIVSVILVIFLSGCDLEVKKDSQIEGSGVKASDSRELSPFTEIELDSQSDVNITFAKHQSFMITGDDNIIGLIKTSVSNGKLRIYSDKSFNTNLNLVVNIVMPELSRIDLNGSGDINVNKINISSFSGNINGSGDITITGTSNYTEVNINGSGNINLFNLMSSNVKARINGSGDINVYASKTLDAEINGSGDITYKGGCYVTTKINGSGKIKSRNL